MPIKTNQYGIKGLLSSKRYCSNDVITELLGELKDIPSYYSIQIADGKHIEVEGDIKYVNHHCHPSARISKRKLIAIEDILPGNEITFDYNSTEDVLSSPFICNCCGKLIQGKKF